MGFDKAKALSAAEKFLSQGKIPAAIQEYRKIVERDPLDFTALNTLGDLYVRTNQPGQALSYFVRVADHYREQGFALKAIAMYKKISRFSPEEPGVALNLARLYEQQGLYVEARAQYLQLADSAGRAGNAVDGLEALRRVADIDPKNVDIRLRLAEGYTREGLGHDAAEAYVEAGELMLAAGRSQDALNAYKHAHSLRPESHAVLQGLVAASFAVGAAAEAALVLEDSIANAPGDLELRAMLARTYVEAEDAPAAERATDSLVAAEATNFTVWFDVARLYLRQSAAADAVRVLSRAVEPALVAKLEASVLEILDGALACDPDQIEALKLLTRIHTWRRDDEQLRVAAERLADAAHRADQPGEERRALEQLVRLVPFDQSYHERLSQLGGSPEAASAEPQAEFPAPAEAATRDHQADDARQAAESSFGSVTFDNLAEVNAAHDSPGANFSDSAHSSSRSVTDELASSVAEFEWNTVAPVEDSSRERGATPDAGTSFADLNAETRREGADDSPRTFDFAFERNGFDVPQGTTAAADPFAQDVAADREGAGGTDDRVQALLSRELESVDFYLEQGYTDIARDTLDILERQYGKTPDTDARRERLQNAAETAAQAAGAAAEQPQVAADGAAQSFDDISAFELPAESHPADAGGESVEFSIDEQAFVVDEPAHEAHASAAAEAAPVESAQSGARAEGASMASIFGEFLDATEDAPASRDEDFETHYNLGVAYKEMGLWDEAVEQFQKGVDLCAPSDGTTRYLECCNMLGHSLLEKGIPRAAALWFKKALALPRLSEDESQALRYDLGAAYEQAGDIDRAIDTFSEVYGVDVSYRGVAGRLRELQERKPVTSGR
ncbi:MAG: tetratricopeptide repeat protein [Acidobacteria bacterium]|nr:tetratricopeptide repeat protein [Acidobacteriota bacterium]MCA1640761.1 tetratricopeptide repeat protein [Acidobacteriota bacterium]